MKTITLKYNGVGRYDDVSPFIVTDNSLKLKVKLPAVNGEFYLVTENNSVTGKRLLPEDGTIVLENLTAGELKAEVKHYVKGTLIKVYQVEPLLLKEVDGSVSAEPEIAVLTTKIAELENSIKALKEANEERDEATEERDKADKHKTDILLALVRFAFHEFNENPFLDGGTFDKFSEEFGFEFSKEEIDLITGGHKND